MEGITHSAWKNPFINNVNKARCLWFATTFINMSMKFWGKFLFSSECKFNVFSSDEKVCVWKKPYKSLATKNVCPMIKHKMVESWNEAV